VLDLFLRRFLKDVRWQRLQNRMKKYEMLDIGYDRIIDVPFVNGAFMFVRTSCLRAVGGFDSRYFLYFEDADLSREIQKTHRTVYYPFVSVTHYWERAAHKSTKAALILIANGIRFFNKWGWKFF
jgi:GT2 family glycosyltransferase